MVTKSLCCPVTAYAYRKEIEAFYKKREQQSSEPKRSGTSAQQQSEPDPANDFQCILLLPTSSHLR
ncbi:hypothetical protein ACHAWU_004488 [Discostella pseudostelligera]|uniref:Uncharacterized protein n=1 Tax=Discostella pseudostelligera TaxID=259834 RepID=A0ABD3M4B9_9STRA